MTALAWLVLGLVFVDELLAGGAAGVVGASLPAPWLFVWLLPVLVIALWWGFASPKAPYGGPLLRPAVKVLVFGLAPLGLWLVGHHAAGIALLVFSVTVHVLAQFRFVRAAVDGVRARES